MVSLLRTLMSALLATSACSSGGPQSSCPGAPSPSSPAVSTSPHVVLDVDVPVAVVGDGGVSAAGALLQNHRIRWTSTCTGTCTLHVLDSDSVRARDALRGAVGVRVIEASELAAILAPPEPLAANVEISRADLTRQLQTPTALDVQWNHPGGILVRHVAPASVFAQIGLRDGGVIAAFEGTAVHGEADALRAEELVRTHDRFSIEISRKGHRMTTQVLVR